MHSPFVVLAAALFAAPASAQTMAEALDACESFVATGTIPDAVDTELTLFGDFDYAPVQTEVGPMLLTFAKDYGLNSTTYCDLSGADPRDEAGPIQVTWTSALSLIDPWFAARVTKGGGKLLQTYGAERMFAACSDTAEYFITAQPYPIGDKTAALPEGDWPLVVRITEWTGNAAKPCDF